MYNMILEQNARMLIKLNRGITATGKFGEDLQRDAGNELMVKKSTVEKSMQRNMAKSMECHKRKQKNLLNR